MDFSKKIFGRSVCFIVGWKKGVPPPLYISVRGVLEDFYVGMQQEQERYYQSISKQEIQNPNKPPNVPQT